MGQHPAHSPPRRFLEPTDAKSKQIITDRNSRHLNEDERLTLRTTPSAFSCSALACLRANFRTNSRFSRGFADPTDHSHQLARDLHSHFLRFVFPIPETL
jgi:hypothetical protein